MVKTEYFSDAYTEFPTAAGREGQVSLRVENLTCARGLRVVFADLNFTLAGGGVLHVSGANGAGKTSLLRMICGLLAPAAGTVSLAAGTVSLSDGAELAAQCHYLGHADGLKNTLTPRETIFYESRFYLARATRGGRFAWPCRFAQTGRSTREHAFGGAEAASGADPPIGLAAACVVAGRTIHSA